MGARLPEAKFERKILEQLEQLEAQLERGDLLREAIARARRSIANQLRARQAGRRRGLEGRRVESCAGCK
jgi:hypothetical protein